MKLSVDEAFRLSERALIAAGYNEAEATRISEHIVDTELRGLDYGGLAVRLLSKGRSFMDIVGKVVVVTGGAGGIGSALAQRFKTEGATKVIIIDKDEKQTAIVAAKVEAIGIACDVTSEASVRQMILDVQRTHGEIDIFCSNAGIFFAGDENASNDEWRLNWEVHVMAHVYAARELAPKMATRGEGYLVNTASAAGVLSHINSATYSVSKHAAVAFAEWLAITYGDRGVKVSVLCPQAVRTNMIAGHEGNAASVDGIIEPETVANSVIEAINKEEYVRIK